MHQPILHNGQLLNKLLNAITADDTQTLLTSVAYFLGHEPELKTLVDVCRIELESSIKDWRKCIARYKKAIERIENSPSNMPNETTETLLKTLKDRIKLGENEIYFLGGKLVELNTLHPEAKQAFKPDRWNIDMLVNYVNRHYQ